MTTHDGHTVGLPPTREQAMAHLQALADDCSDGDQAYAVLSAPPEVIAAAMGGRLRIETDEAVVDGAVVDQEWPVIELPPREDAPQHATVATTPLGDLPWYADHANLVTLARWMADTGASAHDVAYAVEKPHKHEGEWRDALAAQKAEVTS